MSLNLTRRQFMVGCSSAIAALAGSRLTKVAFADPLLAQTADQDILVVVFLRGGWDALNVVPPLDGDDRGFYEQARARLKLPTRGSGSVLRLDDQFGLHPALAPLLDLYRDQKLGIVHAVGLNCDTRSHFDAMEFIELGTPGERGTGTGWINRHLQSTPFAPTAALMPTLSTSGSLPTSLLGNYSAVAMNTPGDFTLWRNDTYAGEQRSILQRMYDGSTWIQQAGARTLSAVEVVERAQPDQYTAANGATYPSDSFGDNLKTVAQMIKLEVGLQVATVDLGGWDTHEYQGDGSNGYLAEMLGQLGQGLAAFYADLDGSGDRAYTSRLTVVVMSEFGRRLVENASHGTDHGHGSVMLALGGNVNGGRVHGVWPGLNNEQLYDRADLAVTTDYRQVLSEILVRRLGNSKLSTIFPGYNGYQPLGLIRGDDLTIN